MTKNTQDSDLQDDEPSIEEILSSIRDIIADDEENDAAEENAAEEPKEDILDLTDIVTEDDIGKDVPEDNNMADNDIMDDPNDPLAGINLAHPGDDFDILDAPLDEAKDDGLSDILAADKDLSAQLPEQPRAERPVINKTRDEDTLLDDVTEQATLSSMTKLAQNIVVSRVAPEGVTLDDIVRDLLRPMLKNWLDENLPDVIERLVAKELERLAEKAARK